MSESRKQQLRERCAESHMIGWKLGAAGKHVGTLKTSAFETGYEEGREALQAAIARAREIYGATLDPKHEA